MPEDDHRSEEALRLALEEQRQLLEDIDVVVWKMHPTTLRMTYVTGAAARLGFPLQAWTESADFFQRVLHADERALTIALVRAVAADGEERQCVHRLVSATGNERWFRTRVRASLTTTGRVRELLGVMLDITERISTETSLRDAEEHLRRLLMQLPAVVWTTDRELRFTSGVGRELLALGIPSSGALMGVSIQEYLRITDPNHPTLLKYRRALAGEAVSMESEWMGRTYHTYVEPFRDSRGAIVGVLALSWNVTERKHAEDTLRLLAEASATLAGSLDYEKSLQKVARLAVGPLASSLANWCIVGVIEGDVMRPVATAHEDPSKEPHFAGIRTVAIESLGSLDDVVKSKASLLLSEVTEAMIAPGTALPLPAGEAGARAAGALRNLGLNSFLLVPLVARDQVLGMVAFGRTRPGHPFEASDVRVAEDLARRCAMAIDSALLYRTAQSAIEARDEFLSVASHELRTPLTSILLRLESLERAVNDGREVQLTGARGALTVVLRQSRRLASLIEQLLDVSRVRRGLLDLELEDVDLSEVLREVGTELKGEAMRAGSSLSITTSGPAVGRWDRARIEQVCNNLLSNAIKFARGSAIDAEVRAEGAGARLVVRDRGMGISAADQARIFQRFERAASSRHYGGLGLGLYITRQIVLAHGGTVRLASDPAEGTTVIVELPFAPAIAEIVPRAQ